MRYKKVILFFTLVLGVSVLCKAGDQAEKARTVVGMGRGVQAVFDKRVSEESEKIAVVNLDEGVQGREGLINYAQELSRFPTMDFEYSSLEAARTGLETGRYGAYVIIPALFSQNVESINTEPQVSQLEYAVNRSYSGERQYELLYNVRSYIDSLNNRLSYMYVDNILKEFHEAQNGADRVMENDLKDKEALEKVEAQDLAVLVELPEYRKEEQTIEVQDLSEYADKNATLASSINEEYVRNVQKIQSEIASLSGSGTALAGRLSEICGQVPEIDFAVDENGESLIEKADIRFQEELKQQSECTLKKEEVTGYLRKLLEDHEEFRRKWEQSENPKKRSDNQSDEPSALEEGQSGQSGDPEKRSEESGGQPDMPEGQLDMPEGQPDMSEGEPDMPEEQQEQLEAWLEKEEQEIRIFLDEVEKTENLDTAKISELARTEYTDPVISKADETGEAFRQRYEEEIAAVTSYNERLAAFRPQIDENFITQNTGEMNHNYALMQDILYKNHQAYKEFAQESTDSAKEYKEGLEKYIEETQKKSEEAVKEGLSELQKTKKKTSFMNQKILKDFASMLPYTKIGDAENVQVYRFVANPLEAKDDSDDAEMNGSFTKKEDNVSIRTSDQSLRQNVSGSKEKKWSYRIAVYIAAGIGIVLLVVSIYCFLRRKKNYEY